MPDLKIHILDVGRPLCGREGTPNEWSEQERWVDMRDADKATCAECVRVWRQPEFEKLRKEIS